MHGRVLREEIVEHVDLGVGEVAVLQVLSQLLVSDKAVIFSGHLDCILDVESAVVDASHAFHVVHPHHEEVAELEGRLLALEVSLHLAVRVVDDGQEHVEEDEEDKEDVGEEVDRPKQRVCLLDHHKVEVAENCSEESVARVDEVVEIFNLRSKEKETKLSKGKEDDEEHDGEAREFF